VASFVSDLVAVLRVAPTVEMGRVHRGPQSLLRTLRARGARGPVRSDVERRRLGRIIRVVDACFPGGGNCYRRALLEIAVDPQAAATPLNLGLRNGGGSRSGHAWLGHDAQSGVRYDAEFSV
jgi:hypothetical protein